MRNKKTKDMVLCAMFVALITVGAFLKIPIPMVPVSFQNLFTMLAGLLLGGKLGCACVCIYIFLGLLGLPVFTQGGGIGYIFQPSFGYLIGFAIGAYVTGTMAHRKSRPTFKWLLLSNLAGLAIYYPVGMLHYYVICRFYLEDDIGIWALIVHGFLTTIVKDVILCIVGALIGRRMIPLIKEGKLG